MKKNIAHITYNGDGSQLYIRTDSGVKYPGYFLDDVERALMEEEGYTEDEVEELLIACEDNAYTEKHREMLLDFFQEHGVTHVLDDEVGRIKTVSEYLNLPCFP